MNNNLSLIEELNIEEYFREPFSAYVFGTLIEKKTVAYSVFQRKITDILLISSGGFLFDSVFAGLRDEHVQFISRSGPKDYKVNLLEIIRNKEKMVRVFEIAKAMDEDLGSNTTQNRDRVKNVIQYIKDNRIAFEF